MPKRALQQLEDARVHGRLGAGTRLQAEHERAHVRDGGAVKRLLCQDLLHSSEHHVLVHELAARSARMPPDVIENVHAAHPMSTRTAGRWRSYGEKRYGTV